LLRFEQRDAMAEPRARKRATVPTGCANDQDVSARMDRADYTDAPREMTVD